MGITACKACGKEVAASAKSCPSCGVSNPGIRKKDMIAGVIVVGIAVAIGVTECTPSDKDKQVEKQPVAETKAAQAAPLPPTIKPEMIVTFPQGAVACLTKDELLELSIHAAKGEATKANAMKGCTGIAPGKKVKVLAVEYNADPSIGIMEIVGAEPAK